MVSTYIDRPSVVVGFLVEYNKNRYIFQFEQWCFVYTQYMKQGIFALPNNKYAYTIPPGKL